MTAMALFLVSGCSSAVPPSEAPAAAPATAPQPRRGGPADRAEAVETSAAADPELGPSVIIQPGRTVPPFAVETTTGLRFDSTELVGSKPFVVILFASWCRVCHIKIPLVQRILDEVGSDITTIGVALDERERWSEVDAFVDRYALTFPIVRGEDFERFVLAYNPTGGVPAVLVVAPDGKPIEYQLGVAPTDPLDLAAALLYVNELAKPTGKAPTS